ncbi:hypothetical protein DFH06DRAFT_1372675 [Mycena polygramma]|nr:hypothetical protein DFH06DRAFT_1372675 [Mycena polygramma]
MNTGREYTEDNAKQAHIHHSVPGSLSTGAPWYLGQISTRWREIALALPSLWSSITVLHTVQYSHEKASPLPMVQAQLIRSANEPLDVDFEWWRDEMDAGPYLADLVLHSDRWASFRLLCRDNLDPLLQLLHPGKGRLSRLNTLEIGDPDWDEDVPFTALDTFFIAPVLREVLLTSATFYFPSPALLIPWHQITRYRGVATMEYRKTLDDAVIVSPHLHRLYVERGDFLDHFIAPELAYLSCNAVEPILPFLQRSACQLTTLVLTLAYRQPFALPPADVISLLQHTSALKSLVLEASPEDQQGNDRILSALTVTGALDICPALTFFAYGSATDVDLFSRDIFIRMIHSRLHSTHICRLSRLRVLCPPTQDKAADNLDEMQTLV